jgi:hypothetical protein
VRKAVVCISGEANRPYSHCWTALQLRTQATAVFSSPPPGEDRRPIKIMTNGVDSVSVLPARSARQDLSTATLTTRFNVEPANGDPADGFPFMTRPWPLLVTQA